MPTLDISRAATLDVRELIHVDRMLYLRWTLALDDRVLAVQTYLYSWRRFHVLSIVRYFPLVDHIGGNYQDLCTVPMPAWQQIDMCTYGSALRRVPA